MMIRFAGYRIVVMARKSLEGRPIWEAIVMEGLLPCARTVSVCPLKAISDVTILYHEVYLAGKERVRKLYWLDKPNTDETPKVSSPN